jgi:crotonobetainyl-CoA:carnitine CoA-transferase CaiB-like acyl-CoA transferase
MSGVMSITGVPDGEPGAGPNLVGYSISDITAGNYAVIAILAALHHRDTQNGNGQHLDIALYDAQVHSASHMAMNYMSSGKVPTRNGTASQITCPWQAFNAADKPIIIAVGNDAQFSRLCALLGCSELASDLRFVTNIERVRHKDILIPLLAKPIKDFLAAELQDKLEEIGIPAGPINTFKDILEDPQLRHREVFRSLPHNRAGEIGIVSNPIRFSETAVVYERVAPDLGQHTSEVLAEELGFDDAAITALRDAKVIT